MSEAIVDNKTSFSSFLPTILVIVGSVLMVLLRIQVGGEKFIFSDGGLMMLALACYLTAAVFSLMNLYAPSNMAEKIGFYTAAFGVFFNFSSWCVRWVNAHDRELTTLIKNGYGPEQMPWLFRYIPFANLYDLSLAFAFGAGITTLLIAQRKSFRFIGAVSLPIAALILVLARFIGSEFIDLPPILDSYWRPIHVGIASLSYGIALVCFAIAVLYLLKDGVKTEAMAIWSCIFGFLVIASIGKGTVLTSFTYSVSTVIPTMSGRQMPLPLRADIPYAGLVLAITALLLIGVIVSFIAYIAKNNEQAKAWGHRLLKISLVAQACGIALIASQVKTMQNVMSHVNPAQYERFGKWLAEQQGLDKTQIASFPSEQLVNFTQQYLQENGSKLMMSLKANPVEFSALITAFAATLFVIIFSFRTERLKEALPELKKLDSLMYLTASATFAGLAMLLITGAVWANESWGRYWGWDPKETGAFVAWVTYGVFLHTRITHGWSGRPSAYFALAGFLFVIFTYLGVSYLLPGLHSYA
jgi:cytochrome c-type biogenesis protein CcsB